MSHMYYMYYTNYTGNLPDEAAFRVGFTFEHGRDV